MHDCLKLNCITKSSSTCRFVKSQLNCRRDCFEMICYLAIKTDMQAYWNITSPITQLSASTVKSNLSLDVFSNPPMSLELIMFCFLILLMHSFDASTPLYIEIKSHINDFSLFSILLCFFCGCFSIGKHHANVVLNAGISPTRRH